MVKTAPGGVDPFRGKLTLINTRLPLRSQSVMDNLFARDILSIGDQGDIFSWLFYNNAGREEAVRRALQGENSMGVPLVEIGGVFLEHSTPISSMIPDKSYVRGEGREDVIEPN